MRSALSVVIAALLVTSIHPMAIAAAATAPDGTPAVAEATDTQQVVASEQTHAAVQVEDNGTTTRLGLTGSTESAYTDTGPDLGATLAANDDELRREWAFQELEYQWSDLSEAERRDRIEAFERRINGRLVELEEREQTVVGEMRTGDASAARVLRTLARTDHEASVLATHLNRLAVFADEVPNFSLTRSTMGAIETHQGPVRDRAFRTMSASDPTGSTSVVLVEATESGVVVSTTTSGSYLREATRYDNRDPSLPRQYEDLSEGSERIGEIYPWVQGTNVPSESLVQYPPIQQFTFDVQHPQGLLRAHLDSGTTDVFRENQELWIADLPVDSAGTWTGESTTVSLNVTPRDGPVQVTVTETETGDPVAATILVDEQPIAETGPDGTIWLVRPMADDRLTVQTAEESITVDPDR